MPRKHKLLQTLTKSHKSHLFSTKNLILIWWLQMVRKMGGIKSILLYQNIFYHKFVWLAISILFTSIITERNYWSRFDWLYLINRATELSNFQNGLFFPQQLLFVMMTKHLEKQIKILFWNHDNNFKNVILTPGPTK